MVVVKKDSMRKTADAQPMCTPPDGGWGWVVVFASFMIHVIADGVTYTFGIFYYEFLKYFGSSKGTTAWVASIMVGTTYCIGPVASGLTNKYGCRAVTVAGAILAGTGLAISTLAPNVLFLFFSTGLCTGAGLGLMYLPSIVSVTCYFEKQRAFATGVAVCGSGIGTFALAPLTEYLVEAYGWKGAMLLISGLVFNCAVFGALFRPLEPPPAPKLPGAAPLLAPESEAGLSTPLMCQADRKTILEEPPFPNENEPPPKLTNGFVSLSKPDISTTNGYSTHPSTPCEMKANGFTKLRSNLEKKEDPSCRNSQLLPSEFLRRKVEGGPLSSFVCSSASLAQTNKELSQLSPSQSHTGGLMCRKDIFYSGSLVSLSRHRSSPNLPCSGGAAASAAPRGRRRRGGCCAGGEIGAALAQMTDFSLLRDPVFLLFAASNFLTSIGFNVPYVYTKDRVADMGIEREASFLLSIIGISNTVGRVTLGFLSDRACANRLWIYNVSLIICGLATALSCYATDYTLMAMYCATFGATAGAYVSLTSVILVDLLGLDKLTNAFGILLVFEGISCLLGPPITGWLYDGLGSYDPGFYMSGCMIAVSGLILFLVPCLGRKLAPDEQLQPTIRLTAESAA